MAQWKEDGLAFFMWFEKALCGCFVGQRTLEFILAFLHIY